MSSWVRTSPDAKSVARDGAAAIAAANGAPPQVATLILPADTAWNEADGVAQVPKNPSAPATPRRPSTTPPKCCAAANRPCC